jgi:autotransporter-associated beta strand protein
MSFNGISFGAFVGTPARTVAHDEVRLGQTWSDVTIPVPAQPAFASQPQATSTAYVGGSVSLTAVANGYPAPAYQWYKGATLLAGQTSPTLTLTNLQPGDAGGDYRLTATNSEGSATTNDATVVVLAAPAGLLAYEGFDYKPGSSNLDGKAGGLGWGAAWAAVNGGGGNAIAGSLVAGANAPNGYDGMSLGNSSFIPTDKRSGRLLDTTPGGRFGAAGYIDTNGNIGASGKRLYLSFLQQPDGTAYFYEFELHRGDLGDPGRIGGVGNDTSDPTVSLRTGNAKNVIGPGSTGVNFYVVRIDYKDGNDDVRVYQNPVSATEPGVPTLAIPAASDMSFNGISLAAFVNGRTVKHDEIRLGQNWSDVVFGASRRQLTWVGDSVSNLWNSNAPNWNDGSGATQFADGDPVTFDDTGSDSPAVNVQNDVATASITANHGAKNYTIGGAGTINVSGGLAKSGSGSLTFTGATSFGSALVVNGGGLALNGTSSIAGDLDLNAGATSLILNGTNTFSGSSIALAGMQTLGGTNSFAGIITYNSDVTISGPTSLTGAGAAVWIGNLTGASSTLTIEPGGSLTMTGNYKDAWVIGRDGGSGAVIQNGGTVTYNPANRDTAYIGASAAGGAVSASYEMNDGTLEMSDSRLGIALGPITATLTQHGGNINVRQLDLGANFNTGTGIFNLTDGTMRIGAGGITTASGLYQMNLAGGTIAAAADWSSGMDMSLTGGNVTFDTADRTVTLTGGLEDAGGLVKTGSGTLILRGYNTYSGPTMVNAGTLAGYGNYDLSAFTVAAGAAISPGIPEIGVFLAQSIDFASGSTYMVKINSSTMTADELDVLGAVDIDGANASFTEIGNGFIPAGSQLTIVSSGGLTGRFAGYPEGAAVSAGANTFTIHYTSTTVSLTSTTVASPYEMWAAQQGLDGSPGREAAFDADPDHDGVANGLEGMLGGDPLVKEASSLVTSTATAGDGITLSFTREEDSLGSVNLFVQWSADLNQWNDVPITQGGGSYPHGEDVDIDETADPDKVIVHIPASNAVGGRLFARLRAVAP